MNKPLLTTILSGFLLSTSAGVALAADNAPLANYENDSNITLVGTVRNISGNEFQLQTGDQMIGVDVGTWDLTNDVNLKNYLQNGQKVVVNGNVDKNWFTDDEVEANNLYFQDQYDYYYVTDANPAYSIEFNDSPNMKDGSFISLRGTVQSVDGEEFTISSKNQTMTIDTADMGTRAQGQALNLEQGDRVFVYGEIDDGFFDNQEISADSVIKVNEITSSRG